LSSVTVVIAVALVPAGAADVDALLPVAAVYLAVQLVCAVIALRARRPAMA
jgi:hypothetical protein